jgi:alkylation response protein AidB-like acyl-CoA dehydrogenase
MALGLTEEHVQLADSVRAWAERHSPPGVARAVADGKEDGAAQYRDVLRPSLADQGLLGLHVPEADGGQGFGLPELTIAVEELGRALVPGGLVPTALASAVLVAAGVTGKLVAPLAHGDGNGAVALAADFTAAAGSDGDLIITGTADGVLGAAGADVLILPVRSGPDTVWLAVDASSLDITQVDSLDLTRPLGQVSAADVIVPAGRRLAGLSSAAVANLAAVVLGAEAIGVAGWAVDTAAEYAKLRHQFGRPIGQFQAVKHRCARMLVATEQATAAVWDAARALDGGEAGGDFAAAAAAVLAAEAAVSCAHECIQVLGGIGYTWEHDAHLYYRRAMTISALLSSAAGRD